MNYATFNWSWQRETNGWISAEMHFTMVYLIEAQDVINISPNLAQVRAQLTFQKTSLHSIKIFALHVHILKRRYIPRFHPQSTVKKSCECSHYNLFKLEKLSVCRTPKHVQTIQSISWFIVCGAGKENGDKLRQRRLRRRRCVSLGYSLSFAENQRHIYLWQFILCRAHDLGGLWVVLPDACCII